VNRNIDITKTLADKLKDIEENLYFEGFDNKQIFVDENGLDYLLTFCSNSFYFVPAKLMNGKFSIIPVINCNDLFWWAMADYEVFSYSDIEGLYKASKEKWGISKWVCKKRSMRPQHPIENDMKKDGAWDEEMELLPERGSTG
jgi:hypothetical protein